MDRSKLNAFISGEIDTIELAKEIIKHREDEEFKRQQEREERRAERERRIAERRKHEAEADQRRGAKPGERALHGYAQHLEELRGQLRGEAPPNKLRYWLLLDSWTPLQAFSLFSGYSPERLEFDAEGKLKRDYRGEFGGLRWLNGLDLNMFITEEVLGIEFLKKQKLLFEENINYLYDIWKTGTHSDLRYHPSYYFDWAQRKRIRVSWLDWARAEGLLSWEEKQAAVTASGEVSGKAESNYLNLIGALCELYWRAAHGDAPIVQQRILDALSEYKDYPGLSERNLKDKISRALKSIQNPK
jgi:hypothetical protein